MDTRHSTKLFVALVFLTASIAVADISYDRYLLPVYSPFPIDGAIGSRWVSEVTLSNGSDQPVQVQGVGVGCPFDACSDIPIPPGVTVPLFFRSFEITDNPGRFLDVQKNATAFAIQLRIRDTSRENISYGAEVPVVHESRAVAGTVNLANVPLAANYRQLLRVYDFSQILGASIRLRFFNVAPASFPTWPQQRPDTLIGEVTIPLSVHLSDQPGYAQFSDFTSIAEVSGDHMLRIEIEPLNSNSRIWAFVSLTNNDTQQVTIVTPQ